MLGDRLCFEISSLPVHLCHVPDSTDGRGRCGLSVDGLLGRGLPVQEGHVVPRLVVLSSKFGHSSFLETGPLAPAAWPSWRVGCSSCKYVPPRPRGGPRRPPCPGPAACKPGGRLHVHAPRFFLEPRLCFFASVLSFKKSPRDFCPLKFLIF